MDANGSIPVASYYLPLKFIPSREAGLVASYVSLVLLHHVAPVAYGHCARTAAKTIPPYRHYFMTQVAAIRMPIPTKSIPLIVAGPSTDVRSSRERGSAIQPVSKTASSIFGYIVSPAYDEEDGESEGEDELSKE